MKRFFVFLTVGLALFSLAACSDANFDIYDGARLVRYQVTGDAGTAIVEMNDEEERRISVGEVTLPYEEKFFTFVQPSTGGLYELYISATNPVTGGMLTVDIYHLKGPDENWILVDRDSVNGGGLTATASGKIVE